MPILKPLALACLILALDTALANAAPPAAQQVSSTITALPAGPVRTKLLKQVATVNSQLHANQLCPARAGLAKLRVAALAKNAAPAAAQAAIAASTLQTESSLLARAATKTCGGAAPANGSDASLRDVADNDVGVTLRLSPPTTSFSPQVAGGAAAVSAAVGDLDPHGQAFGDPEVSTATTLVAVPRGDTLALAKVTARSYLLKDVPLAPYEDSGGAQAPTPFYLQGDYAPQPFTRSAKFKSTTPGRVVTLGREFNFRGTQVVPVTVSATRYNGAGRSLQVFTDVSVGLTFKGAGTVYGPSWVGSEANAGFTAGIANIGQVVKGAAPTPKAPNPQCPEMLLITDKAYVDDANLLANHKDQIGVPTRVLTTATLTTQAKIHDAIFNAIVASSANCATPLDYVLLLGSTTAIPPYLRHSTRNATYAPLIATDFPYFVPVAAVDQLFPVAEVFYGRLPARSEAEAKFMVEKTINYESSPPKVDNAIVAGMFQYSSADDPDPRRESNEFIKPLIKVANRMKALGKQVQELFTKEDGATPREYADGSSLPSYLLPPYATWNATGSDVVNAINQHESVVIHDDHGYSDGGGWVSPNFNNSTISGLHNGGWAPFVVSVDCDSGDYQNATESFAEQLMSWGGGGAIGTIAASRMTNTGANQDYTLAVASALYGGLIPGESSASQYPPGKTMGDVLFTAQLRFGETQGFFLDPVVVDYKRQYNLFGDPSLVLAR
jgi:hypothetical protein